MRASDRITPETRGEKRLVRDDDGQSLSIRWMRLAFLWRRAARRRALRLRTFFCLILRLTRYIGRFLEVTSAGAARGADPTPVAAPLSMRRSCADEGHFLTPTRGVLYDAPPTNDPASLGPIGCRRQFDGSTAVRAALHFGQVPGRRVPHRGRSRDLHRPLERTSTSPSSRTWSLAGTLACSCKASRSSSKTWARTNGTFVNGEKIKRARLKEGDRVLIGTSIIRVALSEGSELDRVRSEDQAARDRRRPTHQPGAHDERQPL